MAERETLGLEAIRLLAHPLRRRMEEELRKGPVSATSLARALGESTGLTSYHLRQLAKYGFVEEVPELRKGRERWWRFVPKDRRISEEAQRDPETRAVLKAMVLQDLTDDLLRFDRALDRVNEGPWASAFPFSRAEITVNLEEFKEFFEAYIALLYKYKPPADETSPDARTVQVRLFAFPAE